MFSFIGFFDHVFIEEADVSYQAYHTYFPFRFLAWIGLFYAYGGIYHTIHHVSPTCSSFNALMYGHKYVSAIYKKENVKKTSFLRVLYYYFAGYDIFKPLPQA